MITLTYEISFINEDTGYSCWVQVSSDDGRPGYAQHCGYVSPKHSATYAQDHAFGRASDMQRVLQFAGVQSCLIEGKHELRAGERIYRTDVA